MSDQENNEIFRPLEKLIKRPNPVPYKKFVVPMPIEINKDNEEESSADSELVNDYEFEDDDVETISLISDRINII